MNADKTNTKTAVWLNDLSEQALGAAFEVSNALGGGFLEKVYQRALLHELKLRGLRTEAEVSYSVSYKGKRVGDYFADILVEDAIVIEVKCVERLSKEHFAQCLNYLRASGLSLCLLINFQRTKLEWQRIVHEFPEQESLAVPTPGSS